MTIEGAGPVTAPERRCWACGHANPAGYNFCSQCGRPLQAAPPYAPPKQVSFRDLGRTMGAYSVLALLFILAINVVILIWGIGQVYPHLDKHVYLFIITPFILNFAELGGMEFFLYYVFLAAAITLSFIWMMRKSLFSFSEELLARSPEKGPSPVFVIGTLFMAVLAFNVIFYIIVEASGIAPSTPDFESRELWQSLYGFAHASVWEEVASRILLIGVPLLIIDGLLEFKYPQRKMRKARQYILGGGIPIGRIEAALLVVSSIMFGFAHVFAWDLYKIFPAAVAGLAFGYLFLKLGVYAAILLHFAFDFMSIPLELAPGNLALEYFIGLLTLLWIVVGTVFIVYYAAKGLGWLIGRRIWPDVPAKVNVAAVPTYYAYAGAAPYNHPPVYQSQQAPPPVMPRHPTAFGYRCHRCGNGEASYRDGRLVCTKCGNVD